jgi:hypothetical protein
MALLNSYSERNRKGNDITGLKYNSELIALKCVIISLLLGKLNPISLPSFNYSCGCLESQIKLRVFVAVAKIKTHPDKKGKI